MMNGFGSGMESGVGGNESVVQILGEGLGSDDLLERASSTIWLSPGWCWERL